MAKNYLDQVLVQLNPMQKKILSLRIKGYRRIDICRQLKISPQRHDYAVRKIKKCLQEILQEFHDRNSFYLKMFSEKFLQF